MDKASDFESEDCGFDPHRGLRVYFFSIAIQFDIYVLHFLGLGPTIFGYLQFLHTPIPCFIQTLSRPEAFPPQLTTPSVAQWIRQRPPIPLREERRGLRVRVPPEVRSVFGFV